MGADAVTGSHSDALNGGDQSLFCLFLNTVLKKQNRRLAGSLVVAGWEVLTGGMTTECSLTHWSGDLVLQMSRKQRRQQSLQQRQWEPSPAAGLSMTPRGPRPDDRTAMAEVGSEEARKGPRKFKEVRYAHKCKSDFAK